MIDTSKEYILCSAILRKEPKPETVLRNSQEHLCELGLRHCSIRDRFPGELHTGPAAQGFFTSKSRFVSREEAEQIARECGQLQKPLIGSVLTSEDLW